MYRTLRRHPNLRNDLVAKLPRQMSAPELIAANLQGRELILDPVLATDSLALLYGPRGLGKTFVALGIAWAVAGGGKLASQILTCMEVALNKTAKEYSRYGSATHKQVYIYGSLNIAPVELMRNYGMAWGVGGWLLTAFLQKIGRSEQVRLRERVVKSLKTTFASHYTKTVSLTEALDLANIAVYGKRATGEKYLINPNKA